MRPIWALRAPLTNSFPPWIGAPLSQFRHFFNTWRIMGCMWVHVGPYGSHVGSIWVHMVPYGCHMRPLRIPYGFHMRPIWTRLGPYGIHMGPIRDPHGPIWIHMGRIWTRMGSFMCPCGAICWPCESICYSYWSMWSAPPGCL